MMLHNIGTENEVKMKMPAPSQTGIVGHKRSANSHHNKTMLRKIQKNVSCSNSYGTRHSRNTEVYNQEDFFKYHIYSNLR